MASTHSLYEPFPWFFWVRIAQLVLTVLVIALCAAAASQSFYALGVSFSFWTIAWSLIWIPSANWGMPRVPARYRPNLIVLIFECLSVLWWLTSFSLLATVSSAQSATDHLLNSYGYDSSDYLDDVYGGNSDLAFGLTKAATAFAAFTWALFVTTFIFHCIRIHRQRRERLSANYQMNTNAGGHGTAAEVQQNGMSDKAINAV